MKRTELIRLAANFKALSAPKIFPIVDSAALDLEQLLSTDTSGNTA